MGMGSETQCSYPFKHFLWPMTTNKVRDFRLRITWFLTHHPELQKTELANKQKLNLWKNKADYTYNNFFLMPNNACSSVV